MYPAKRLLLLVLAGVFLLVAAYGFFGLYGEEGFSRPRYVVQYAAVSAAGLVGLFLCWWGGRKPGLQPVARVKVPRRFIGNRFEGTTPPWKHVLGLLLMLAIAAAAWKSHLDKPDWVMAGHAILLFVLCVLTVPYIFAVYRPGKPTLFMDERGLEHAYFGWVPWSDVHGIYLETKLIRNIEIKQLVLGVSNPQRYFARMPWIIRFMSWQLETPRGFYGILAFPPGGMGVSLPQLVRTAETLRDRATPPRVKDWHPGMTPQEISAGLEKALLKSNSDGLPASEVLRRQLTADPSAWAQAHALRGKD